MKVKDLLEAIEDYKKEYPDLLEWDIYTEQLNESDKKFKRRRAWETKKDSEHWEYFKCQGWNTLFLDEKILTINVNY